MLRPARINFEEAWQELKEPIRRVLSLQPTERGVWRDCFSLVYAVCVAQPEPFFEPLYRHTWVLVDEYMRELAQRVHGADHCPSAEDLSPDPEDGLLTRYSEAWYDFMKGANNLDNMFSYFNQQFVFKDKGKGTVFSYDAAISEETGDVVVEDVGYLDVLSMCVFSWYRLMLQPLIPRLGPRVTLALRRYRSDLPPKDSRRQRMLSAVIDSVLRVHADRSEPLDLYHDTILKPYLVMAIVDHVDAANDTLHDSDISRYMKHTLESLHRELRLAETFLHASSLQAVRDCFEQTVVSPRTAAMHEFAYPLLPASDMAERCEDLRRMYTLLRPLGEESVLPLCKHAEAQMANDGTDAMRRALQLNAPAHFVETVLVLRSKFMRLFTDVFAGNEAFFAALDRGCTTCVNVRLEPDSQSPAPELLARYMDSLLRKRATSAEDEDDGQTEAEIEEKLTASMMVFKYVDDKDFFRKYYARYLTMRLLRQTFATMEREEAMIKRLQAACGSDYTNNLRRMITDVTLSTDVNMKFQEQLNAAEEEAATRFSAQVLQAGAWPLAGAHEASDGEHQPSLPLWLERPLCLFEQFYRASFKGRKLIWLQHLCRGELRTRYTRRPYYISAVGVQCAILLSFETVKQWTAKELRESLHLSQETWLRAVRPVIKCGLLLLVGGGGGVGEPSLEDEASDAKLRLNMAFTSNRTKVRLTNALPATADGARPRSKVAANACDRDRKLFLQAAIVRIMKNRKLCTHKDLIIGVKEAASDKFMPPLALIEKCIETLIEKEYMERAPEEPNTYKYLA